MLIISDMSPGQDELHKAENKMFYGHNLGLILKFIWKLEAECLVTDN